MKKLFTIASLILLASCSDGRIAKLKSWGNSRTIECYSGGKQIYKGASTGKIQSEQNSDGYFFSEMGTNKLIEVSGNCILGK